MQGTHRQCLSELALPLWDEYVACRASARLGDRYSITAGFMNCLAARSPKPPRFRRRHWHVNRAAHSSILAMIEIRRPLLSAAYLIGHLDGLGAEPSVAPLSTPARNSALAPCWESLWRALRQTWQLYGEFAASDDMDGLTPS